MESNLKKIYIEYFGDLIISKDFTNNEIYYIGNDVLNSIGAHQRPNITLDTVREEDRSTLGKIRDLGANTQEVDKYRYLPSTIVINKRGFKELIMSMDHPIVENFFEEIFDRHTFKKLDSLEMDIHLEKKDNEQIIKDLEIDNLKLGEEMERQKEELLRSQKKIIELQEKVIKYMEKYLNEMEC